jgi:hypothetical protein
MLNGISVLDKGEKTLKARHQQNRTLAFFRTNVFLVPIGVLTVWFVFLQLSILTAREAWAKQSTSSFTEKVKSAIKTLSPLLLDPVSKNNITPIERKKILY